MAGPDPTLCPLCGQPNRCAMEQVRGTGSAPPPCWCTQVDFSPEALALLPAELQGKVCICAACATGAAPQ